MRMANFYLLSFLLFNFGGKGDLAESETSKSENSTMPIDPFLDDDGVIGSVGHASIPGTGALTRNFGILG